MRFLIDTHILLWLLAGSTRISTDLARTLADTQNTVFISTASTWEIAIKVALGKLALPPDIGHWLPAELAAAGIKSLPVELAHSLGVERLPPHHADPFDRLLISQALAEDLMLVSADRVFAAYDVHLIRC